MDERTHGFIVKVTKDGGAQGDARSPASWTYTVNDMKTGRELATRAEVHRARANGQRNFAQPGTYGFACEVEGQIVLLDVYGESEITEVLAKTGG